MAILVGIGAAAALGGAVTGTISPQVSATIRIFDNQNIANAGIILIGTLSTLIYFQFGVPRKNKKSLPKADIIQGINWVGQAFIAITFSALFAGVYFAALTALVERLSYIWIFVRDIFLPAILG